MEELEPAGKKTEEDEVIPLPYQDDFEFQETNQNPSIKQKIVREDKQEEDDDDDEEEIPPIPIVPLDFVDEDDV